MDVNSLPKTVTRQRRGCSLNPGPSAPESSTLTTRLSSHLRPAWGFLLVFYSSRRPKMFRFFNYEYGTDRETDGRCLPAFLRRV